MSEVSPVTDAYSPWPHRLAIVLVCATFPLIWIGGLVTTEGAGMAFRDWPTSDGYNLFLYPWLKAAGDKFVEHGHRLLGSVVGLVTIALVAVLFWRDCRAWMKVLGCLALFMVIAQGVLGGMRVLENDVQLAKIHGCVGPAFFALAVALAVFTSRRWYEGTQQTDREGVRLHSLSIFTFALAYLQLAIGAQVRHVAPGQSPEAFQLAVLFHLIVAAILSAAIVLLAVRIWRRFGQFASLRRPAVALVGLLFVQLALGAGSWIVKYSLPSTILEQWRWTASWTNVAGSWWQSMIITGHVAVGSLILATATMLMLRSLRMVQMPAQRPKVHRGAVEVVA